MWHGTHTHTLSQLGILHPSDSGINIVLHSHFKHVFVHDGLHPMGLIVAYTKKKKKNKNATPISIILVVWFKSEFCAVSWCVLAFDSHLTDESKASKQANTFQMHICVYLWKWKYFKIEFCTIFLKFIEKFINIDAKQPFQKPSEKRLFFFLLLKKIEIKMFEAFLLRARMSSQNQNNNDNMSLVFVFVWKLWLWIYSSY